MQETNELQYIEDQVRPIIESGIYTDKQAELVRGIESKYLEKTKYTALPHEIRENTVQKITNCKQAEVYNLLGIKYQ